MDDNGANPARMDWVERIDRVEQHPITRLFGWFIALVSAGAIIGTCVQIWADLDDRKEERQAREEERVDRAWTRLRDPAGGDTNKGWALSVLLKNATEMSGLDLSCEAIGTYDRTRKDCAKEPIFRDVKVGDDRPVDDPNVRTFSNFEVGNATDTEFHNMTANHVVISTRTFKDTRFYGSSFVGATWLGGLFADNSARIAYSDMSFAHTVNSWLIISSSNVSGLLIDEAGKQVSLRAGGRRRSWAWADYPPRVVRQDGSQYVSEQIKYVVLCDPVHRKNPDSRLLPHFNRGNRIIAAVTGIRPQVTNSLAPAEICKTIGLKKAQIDYRNSYAPSPPISQKD